MFAAFAACVGGYVEARVFYFLVRLIKLLSAAWAFNGFKCPFENESPSLCTITIFAK